MIFHETPLPGVLIIEPQRREDERGYFARLFCRDELRTAGIELEIQQCNESFNHRRGTLRGLHYQAAPFAEQKIVSCLRGAVYDVALDLRKDSPTFGQWHAVELTSENRRMLYMPEGIAHGFQTLSDETELFYQMGQSYSPAHARGIRYDDPQFQIAWPEPVTVISERDRSWPDYDFKHNCPTAAEAAEALTQGVIR